MDIEGKSPMDFMEDETRDDFMYSDKELAEMEPKAQGNVVSDAPAPEEELQKDEFKVGEYFKLKLHQNKDVELFNIELPDESRGKYSLRKYSGNYTLKKDYRKAISNITGLNDHKVKSVIKEISSYIKSNAELFLKKEIDLNTFYIPPEPHQEDVENALKFLEEDSIIFVDADTTDKDTPDVYLLDESINRFIKLNRFKLGEYIVRKYGFRIKRADANEILNSIYTSRTADVNTFMYNNGYYNVITGDFNQEPVFTKNHIEYDFVELADAEEDTLVEKTLKKILIPKTNPEDTRLYDSYLYYIGSALCNDKPKVILYYYGKGSDGKTILMKITRGLFKRMNLSLKEKSLLDDFGSLTLDNKCVNTFDELSKSAFVNLDSRANVKDISGQGIIDSRQMYTESRKEISNMGLVIMASNYLPAVPHSDTAYYDRLQYLCTSNKFSAKIDADNVYPLESNLDSRLREDKAGFEWLIAKAINTYRTHKLGDYYQDRDTTLMKINSADILSNFINSHVEPQTDNIISNKEVCYYFMLFCLNYNLDYTDVDGLGNSYDSLAKDMGLALSNKGYKKAKRSNKGTRYNNCFVHMDVPESEEFNDGNFEITRERFFLEDKV